MEKADPGVLDDSKKPPVESLGACLSRALSGAQRPAGPLAGSEDRGRESLQDRKPELQNQRL